MQTIWQDLRFAVRMVLKLTLAMAIGANAVVFSAVNGLVLRPLNVPHPESLFQVRATPIDENFSYPDYLDLRDRNRSFDGLATYNFTQAGLDTGKNASTAWVCEVSGNYFDILDIQPLSFAKILSDCHQRLYAGACNIVTRASARLAEF